MSNTIKDKAERGSVISTILEVLKSGDKYGYEIIKEVEEKSGVQLKQPSLYSCLTRLENQGIISSYWQDSDIGGRRHYYKYNNNATAENVEEKNITPTIQFIMLDKIENKMNKILNKKTLEIETYNKNEVLVNNTTENKIEKQSNLNTVSPIVYELNVIKNSINHIQNNKEFIIDTFDKNENKVVVKGKSIQELLETQISNNNATIKSLTNIILAHKEQLRLEQEKKTISSNEKLIYNKIGYDNHSVNSNYNQIETKVNHTNQNYQQQSFDFDNVETSKKYLNNVLLKTVSKNTAVKKKTKNIEHFSNVGDLIDTYYAQHNIEVKEFYYTNYSTINKNRYITNTRYFIFNIIELLIYIALSIISAKSIFIPKTNYAFMSLAILQASFCIELFIITFKPKFRFFKHNIWVLLLIGFIKIALSIVVLFINKVNIFTNFDIQYLALLVPILIMLVPILLEKKAEKF